ncbi:MAG TPA: MFS transporter [Phycisphaerae bacterium]|nr:MFS transporter [Phycisphaerae bacterium]
MQAEELTVQSTRRDTANPTASRAIPTLGALLFCAMLPVTLLVAPLKELIGDRFGVFTSHVFMSINMLGAVAIAPLISALTEHRHSRKRLAVLALVADGALLAGMAIVPGVASVLTLRFLEGAAHIMAISSLMALAASWAAPHARGRTMGIAGAAMMFGTACGTRLGGTLWQHWPGWTFQIAGAISVLTAVMVVLVVDEPATADLHARSRLGDAINLLKANAALGVPWAYALMDRLCVGVVVSTFVLYLGEVHHLTADQRSRLLMMFLMPFALLVYPAGRLVDRIGRVWPICLGSLAFGIVFATYGWWGPRELHAVMLISGIVSAIMFAPSLALTADLAPQSNRGLAFTGFNVAGSLGFLLGPLLAGGLHGYCTGFVSAPEAYRLTFAATGALQAACALITLPMLLSLKARNVIR